MPTDIRKRKPTCLIFVRHTCDDQPCLKKTYEKMIEICRTLGMEKFDELILDDHASEQLREKGIPELWLHDSQNKEKPTEPLQDYCVLKFDDGSVKVMLMLADAVPVELPKPATDVMYR